jgi:enoyl-[acyl-carrier protein] reductase I
MINTGGSFSLAGKRGLIIGLANEHSIAYGCAAVLKKMGASLVVSCVNEKAQTFVAPLAAELEAPLIVCNVEQDDALESLVNASVSHLGQIDFLIHSIAWAPKEDLQGRVIDSSAAGFLQAEYFLSLFLRPRAHANRI